MMTRNRKAEELRKIREWLREQKALSIAHLLDVHSTTVYRWRDGVQNPVGRNLRQLRAEMSRSQLNRPS